MTGAVDIGREACERLARLLGWPNDDAPWRAVCEEAAALILALRAALDAAERERDRWRDISVVYRDTGLAADATGYARCVRDAAAICDRKQRDFGSTQYAINQPMSSFGERFACGSIKEAILALLPATDATKEKPDAE